MWTNDTVEWIDVELTSYCNINCPGCLRQVKRKNVDHILNTTNLSFKDMKQWISIDEFPNMRLINFCGSIDEPTLHPEILDIVDHYSKICDVNISSNGSTKTKLFWKQLGEYKISVFFGIDGVDQESLEKYRVGSNFKKIQENYRSFIEAGGNATWQFIVFEHNEHLIEEAEKISKNEGFNNFRTIYSHRKGNQESKKIQKEQKQEIYCKYGNQKRIFVSHTGVVLPCCFLNSEYLQVYAGNKPKTLFDKKFIEYGGPLELGLKYNRAGEILDGDLFKYITDSWTGKPIERCYNTCKRSKQDVFIDKELK